MQKGDSSYFFVAMRLQPYEHLSKAAFLLLTSQESPAARNNVLKQTPPVTRFGIKMDIMKTATDINTLLLEELFEFRRVHHLSASSFIWLTCVSICQTGGGEIVSEP